MALYEKPQAPLTVDENDLGREVTFYEAPLTGGGTIFRCRVRLPGAAPFDGPLVDVLTLAADRTALANVLVKLGRKVLTDQGMTVKP